MNLIKKFKKTFLVFTLILSGVLITACSGQDADSNGNSDETYQLRLSHVVAEDHPFHLAALEFEKEVEEKSEGQIEVELYPNGQLYDSEREAIEATQLGDLEMTRIATPAMAGFIPEFSVLNLPFLFNDLEAVHTALDGELGDELTDLMFDIDLIAFGFGENGFRHLLNNKKPIEKPEDMSGLTMRVIENKMYEDLFNSLGANASPMGFGETYTAIQQGVFDAMDSEIASASTGKFSEVLDYLTLSSHTFTATTNIISKDYFESLPDDLQKILEDATYTLNERHRELNQEYEEEGLKELEETMEVNELTQEQKELFKKATQPVFDEYAEDIGEELVEMAKEANE